MLKHILVRRKTSAYAWWQWQGAHVALCQHTTGYRMKRIYCKILADPDFPSNQLIPQIRPCTVVIFFAPDVHHTAYSALGRCHGWGQLVQEGSTDAEQHRWRSRIWPVEVGGFVAMLTARFLKEYEARLIGKPSSHWEEQSVALDEEEGPLLGPNYQREWIWDARFYWWIQLAQ